MFLIKWQFIAICPTVPDRITAQAAGLQRPPYSGHYCIPNGRTFRMLLRNDEGSQCSTVLSQSRRFPVEVSGGIHKPPQFAVMVSLFEMPRQRSGRFVHSPMAW